MIITQITENHGGCFEMVKKISHYLTKQGVGNGIVSLTADPKYNSLEAKKVLDEHIISIDIIKKLQEFTSSSKIIYYHNLSNLSSLILCFFLKLKRKKIAVIFHSNMDGPAGDFKKIFFLIRKKIVLNSANILANKIIFLNKSQKENFMKHFIFKKRVYKKTEIIGNFIEKEHIKQDIEDKNNGTRIIYVGRLTSYKGLDTIVEFLKRIKGTSIHFTIIGSGPKKNELPRQKNLELIDRIPNKKVLKNLDRHNIFLLPSYTEVFPVTILEGMARGLVILASDIPGIRELVIEGRNGYLFKPGDVTSIVAIVNFLRKNHKKIEEIRRNNIIDIQKYTAEKEAIKYVKVANEFVPLK